MKSSYFAIAFACVICTNVIFAVEEKPQQKIEPVTTTLLASALAPLVTNLLSGLVGQLFKPNDYQDTIIYGRSMRIKMCGDTCVQLTDRASGIVTVGTGNSNQEAVGDATQKMFHELLDKKLLSLHDLCELHIHFPHPDTNNCPGQSINTCDLISPVQFTKPPCTNKLGDAYCDKNKNRCDDHLYNTFMLENCYKTCTNGCKTDSGPFNPCAVGPAF